jgi:hypothetical protein
LVDKARAAKDGNEYHETWAARRALELLMPRDGLNAIAVEGFAIDDEDHLSAAATEVADLVLYYGEDSTFREAERVEVSQFKYSIAQSNKGFVVADASKTLRKFVAADLDHRQKFGDEETDGKLRFSIVTNRPIDPAFASAVRHITEGTSSCDRRVIEQAHQIFATCGLAPPALQAFLRRLDLRGATGSLNALQADVATRIVDWSASSDYMAQARLGSVRALLRAKAGTAGQGRNLVRMADILSALGVADVRELLPAPASFVEVGPVVSRVGLQDELLAMLSQGKPVLVHAAGGIGKTVFMQGLKERLSALGEAVLFDCFGGGNYRSVEDARHLPHKGLLQIVNALAARGLCDPIIPGPIATSDLLRAARRRFEQAVTTLRRADRNSRLVVLLDAADNAAQQAIDQHEPSFPTLLMETFEQLGMPSGVDLIASCRTERIGITVGSASPLRFALQPFSRAESESFLAARVASLSATEADTAHARSRGNPRVLAHVVQEWDSLVRGQPARAAAEIGVEQLIEMRLERALAYVTGQGLQEQVRTLLCGLTVLPPPVPIAEFARAMGLQVEAVESFAADLAPLLDRTFLGIVFRDEPTEVFVRGRYGKDDALLQRLVQRLIAAQDTSVFAARALPRLLNMTDASDAALELAFSEALPAALTSDHGKRAIRTHRLTAALSIATRQRRAGESIQLLVELASVAANGDRLDALIGAHPDLVACAGDPEALRRLAEIRTDWPGARHARLAVAHRLTGNAEEASMEADRLRQWLQWYLERDPRKREARSLEGPKPLEVAAWSLHLAGRGDFARAVRALRAWQPWFGFQVATEFVRVSTEHLGVTRGEFASRVLDAAPSEAVMYAACIELLPDLPVGQRNALLAKLSGARGPAKPERRSFTGEGDALEGALLLASATAIALGARRHARAILQRVDMPRPSFHSFQQVHPAERVSRWLVFATLRCAAAGKAPVLSDILPREARECLPRRLRRPYTAEEILACMQARARARAKADAANGRRSASSAYEEGRSLSEHVSPLLELCTSLAAALVNGSSSGASELLEVLGAPVTTQFSRSEATTRLRRATAREMVLLLLQLGRDDVPALAPRLVTAISGAADVFLTGALECLEVLCRNPQTADSGPELLPWIDTLLAADGDASRTGQVLAHVARVLWPVSRDDSWHYFKRAMQQLHSLGSADYEIVQDMLPLAAQLKKRQLSPYSFQRLANLCEMNFGGEPSKFPWVEFAAAASAAQGLQSLAQVGRWCSREAASYDTAAPPLIVALVRRLELSVDHALSLLMLDEPAEAHWFSRGDIASALLDAAPQRAEELARRLSAMLEADRPAVSGSYSHQRLLEVLQTRLPSDSPTLAALRTRVSELESLPQAATNSSVDTETEASTRLRSRVDKAERLVAERARTCAPLDAGEIATTLKEIAEHHGAWDLRRAFIAQLGRRVKVGERAHFLELLTLVDGLDLDLRLDMLAATLEDWEGTSPSLRERRQDIFERLLALHAGELAEHSWRFRGTFERIAKVSGLSEARAAMVFAGNLTQLPVAANATHWLKLATYVAREEDGQAAHAALTRLLGGPSLAMAGAFGDGEHSAAFHAGGAEHSVVASLLWTRLGSPDAFDRWRAAHAVRKLAELRALEVLDTLVALYQGGIGGPCLAPGVKFHVWDARLWLLTALVRGAKDDPQLLVRYSALFLAQAFAPETPHALLQSFARSALKAAPPDLAASLGLQELLRQHDPAQSPRAKYPRVSTDPYRPAGVPYQDHGFSLDYDFRKHETPVLAQLFGLPAWQVAGMLEEQAVRMDPSCPGMYDGYGGGRRWRSGTDGRFRSYGAHLGWHALLVLAEILRTQRAVAQTNEGEIDAWERFLRRHGLTRDDGLWLSDGTDPYPLASHWLLRTGADHGEALVDDPSLLLALVGFQDHRALAAVVVSGSWESGDGVNINVNSALVARDQAVAACSELCRRPAFDVWLPREPQLAEDEEWAADRDSAFLAWVQSPDVSLGWDEFDPFCATSAQSRPYPGRAFTAHAAVVAGDPFRRSWRDREGGEVMRGLAWGERRGHGEHETKLSASALLCETNGLLRFLTATDQDLAVLVKIDRYRSQYTQDQVRFRSAGAVAVLRPDGTLAFAAPAAREQRTGDW